MSYEVNAITDNQKDGFDNATVIACVPEMLDALKLAYRKHHLGDESIGWDELSDKLADALSNVMGPTGFVAWLLEAHGDSEEGDGE